jgi:hypothetical protein
MLSAGEAVLWPRYAAESPQAGLTPNAAGQLLIHCPLEAPHFSVDCAAGELGHGKGMKSFPPQADRHHAACLCASATAGTRGAHDTPPAGPAGHSAAAQLHAHASPEGFL